MKDENRKDFDQALDLLARILRVVPLDADVKAGYWRVLRAHSIEGFFDGINRLSETYRPHRKDDFPPPALISEVIGGVVERSDTWNCRCCGMAFTAGQFDQMRCGCGRDYCYHCGRCSVHCQDEQVVPLMESETWARMRVALTQNSRLARPVIRALMESNTQKGGLE